MGIFPITPLVRRVQSLILKTFDVSEKEAEQHAAEMVAVAEGWGSPEMAAQLDWDYRIRKDLGEGKKLRWRSEVDRNQFDKVEKQKYKDWDTFIGTKFRA